MTWYEILFQSLGTSIIVLACTIGFEYYKTRKTRKNLFIALSFELYTIYGAVSMADNGLPPTEKFIINTDIWNSVKFSLAQFIKPETYQKLYDLYLDLDQLKNKETNNFRNLSSNIQTKIETLYAELNEFIDYKYVPSLETAPTKMVYKLHDLDDENHQWGQLPVCMKHFNV